jgi:hypothetical protein
VVRELCCVRVRVVSVKEKKQHEGGAGRQTERTVRVHAEGGAVRQFTVHRRPRACCPLGREGGRTQRRESRNIYIGERAHIKSRRAVCGLPYSAMSM